MGRCWGDVPAVWPTTPRAAFYTCWVYARSIETGIDADLGGVSYFIVIASATFLVR